jgi:hypothetical protein
MVSANESASPIWYCDVDRTQRPPDEKLSEEALNARAASFTRVKRTSKCAASRGSLRLSLPLLIAAGSLPAPWNSN